MTPRPTSYLTESKRLILDTGWNLMGLALPVVLGVFAVPYLIQRIGLPRFGLFSLAWTLLGYVGIFDLGLGRAITKVVSDLLHRQETEHLPGLVWASLYLMIILGMVFAAVVIAASPWISHAMPSVTADLRPEILPSLYIIAASAPVLTSSVAFRGLLEAHHNFRLAGCVRIVTGIATLLVPMIVTCFSRSLTGAIAGLSMGRLIGCAASVGWCIGVMPELRRRRRPKWSSLGGLLRLGGWMTVSNILSPIMANADRLLIGGFLTLEAVAFYTTPLEAATKLLILSTALVGVLFPAFSSLTSLNSPSTDSLYRRSMAATSFLLFPAVILLSMFAAEILRIWIGPEFASQSYRVMQIISAGVFVNGLALIPFTLLQAAGFANVVAKAHLLELIVYIPLVILMAKSFGIEGVAGAWSIRVAFDLILLCWASHRYVLTIALPQLYAVLSFQTLFLLWIAAQSLSHLKKAFLLTLFALFYGVVLAVRVFPQWSSRFGSRPEPSEL